MGQADVIIASEQAKAMLQLVQQTAQVNFSTTDQQLPAQKMKIRLSPVYTAIKLNGSLENTETVSLNCKKTGTDWSTGPCFLLPTKGTNTVVSIELNRNDSTITYGYSLPLALQAGYSYNITAGANQLEVNNTLIDPSSVSKSTTSDTIKINNLPTVPSIWDGHIVAYTENISDDRTEADLALVSINEWEDIHSAYAELYTTEAANIADSYQEAGTASGRLSGWNIPSKEEANELRALYANDKAAKLNAVLSQADLPTWSTTDSNGDNIRYLCSDAQYTFTLATSSSGITKGGTKATYHLRLIKKIHVVIEKDLN